MDVSSGAIAMGDGLRRADRIRVGLLSLFGFSLLASMPAVASKFPWEDFDKRLKASQDVAALDAQLLGDSVNLQNGALSFSVTDISIPGNDGLRVELSRTYAVTNQKYAVHDEMLGDWVLETPSISGTFAPDWISAGTPGNRCSDMQPPPVPVSSDGIQYFLSDVFNGLTLEIPGVGGGELLVTSANATRPSSGGPYRWVTNDQIHVSCLSSIKNGTGEGFLAVAPDGTKYWFDWMAQHVEPNLKKVAYPDQASGRAVYEVKSRRRNLLLATRVEDRFGNWVAYSYSNSWNQPAKLTQITAGDGRQISLSYGTNGRVASASDGARTWQYTYGSTPKGRITLSAVIRPDGSRWTYGFGAFSDAIIEYTESYAVGEIHRGCDWLEHPLNASEKPVGTVTHPSGATGTFTVGIQEHGRSNVPLSCANFTSPYWENIPNDDVNLFVISSHAFSLEKKQLSGPGLAVAAWDYSYDSDISTHMYPGTTWDWPVCTAGAQCYEPPCTSDACAGSSRTIVAGPEGTWARYTFGNSFRYNEGKLLKVEKGSGPAAVLETVVNTYDMTRTDKTYPARFGHSLQMNHDGFASEYHRPMTRTVTTRDGVDFARTTTAFDDLAHPTAQTRQSTIAGNPKRDETIVYHRNAAKWVVGQRAKLTVNGIVASETGFDSQSRPTWHKAFGKLQNTLGYHADGTLASYKDGRNYVTSLSNWYRGVPRSIAWPDGTGVSATVNADGTLASTTDENGFKTCYAYDPMGRLAKITHPSESQTGVCDTSAWNATTQVFAQVGTSEYGIPAGHWRQTVQTGNGVKINYFDAMWRPLVVREYDAGNVSATQRFTRFAYDRAGRTAFTSYPSASSSPTTGTRTDYDALGRALRVKQDSELGVLTTTTEYLPGFQTRVTNPRGFQTTTTLYLAYDEPSYDWPRGINHPEGAYTEIYRDVFGKTTALRRRNANASVAVWRRYVYNGAQELCKAIEPETGSTVMAYDAAGNLSWSASGQALPNASNCDYQYVAAGDKVVRSYDARNRPTELRFPDGLGDTVTGYTPDGQPASITAYNGSAVVTNLYEYNRRRLPTRERMQWGSIDWSVYYQYSVNGHVSQKTIGAVPLYYAPNALGQPTKVGAYATGVTYFPNGALKQFTYGNGIVHTLTQNARGLPERSRDAYGSTALLDDSYDYDQNGNVAAISDGATGRNQRGNRTMGYDGLDRLTATASPMYGSWNATYGYDVLDNLTRVKIGGTAARDHWYCYDAANRLSNVKTGGCGGSTVIGLGYDVRGNLANKNGDAFNFDHGNRLRSATVGGVSGSYVYDGHGRRVRDFTGASKYSMYTRDGQLAFVSNLREKKQQWHVYLGNSLIAIRERDTTTGAVAYHYQHTDALGSPVAVTDANRVLMNRSEYEPYGRLLNRDNDDRPGYTGHVMDAATGLVQMQQRYYDPGIGRFLSVDPIAANANTGAGFNRYAYAAHNPYRFKDPDGRCEKPTGSNICQRGLNPGRSVGPFEVGPAFRPLNFSTKPGVALSSQSYSQVSRTADNYNDRTGKKLVVTDGMRTPQDQAARMHYKITHGAGLGEYRNKAAANEIMGAYREAVADGTDPISAMASTIQRQMDRGIYISRHLRGTGADFRDRDMSAQERSILRSSAFDAGAVNVLREGIPPHTHVEY